MTAPDCPECLAGKHGNCDGLSWSDALDSLDNCPCSTRNHQRKDDAMSETAREGYDAGTAYDEAVTEGHSDPLSAVIMQAIGAASACWENLDGAGVFQDQRAAEIGLNVLAFLREQGVPRDATKNDYARVYEDAAGEWRYRVFAGNHRQFDKAEEGLATKANALRALKRKHPHVAYIIEETPA